ncbi:hypothetical protein AZO1586I_679 [Bathymodiolus thermophilus thioautotrophic gill symbiont]|uniref:Uncharacterized protein n=1 Tax=Bathymodiolus thermophilus thioautotrophic gill symbiont TaxID=2360 RepID=A0ABN7G9R9_9GAMM|nr:hypothetical protein AZO1586I_679 [Bathymodiolus thermophilus thioautotrophic gill symbiont]CAC9488136.1 hypothetical protein [uncultured Gammaproteobacteria bacterium]CAC9512294.1 hypothetical protein [uncultured Gammaproteobacteria bacterium]CAC9521403.1 hypothetical protein [uncultured Gammaproteobacteria bacterium]CAC9635205.1 hypothetical protein [uncultured Gammaproteobacteria bacterium]
MTKIRLSLLVLMSKVRHFLNLFTASWWACSFSASLENNPKEATR